MVTLLEVRNLSVGIRRNNEYLPVLNGIDFDIAADEIVGLAGESGCGKSLTALSISRLLPPAAGITGGSIRFNTGVLDRAVYCDMLSLDEVELCRIRGRDISMIFQEPRQSLNPLIRIGAQIIETLRLHGLRDGKQARAAALDIIGKLGLAEPEKIFNAYPHQLSGGMCQRVMIAIATICRPKLLIADEPTTALDQTTQNQILALLEQINRDFGVSILFISHDLSAVRRFCRRFLVMYAGRIVEEGSTETLFSSPAHPYTRGLIGAIPNREHRGRPLVNISGRTPSIEDRFSGCSFAPRCPQALEKCLEAFPLETDLGDGHRVRCVMAGAGYD
ncbi:MAG: ABC transporter ATP-binding protein [Treponema sp.]|jgi:oligopeptide/dipeptide ABC transporter ATP-binding protein|nr:ABC transporter ATP-binding protein [Treponema sp.]